MGSSAGDLSDDTLRQIFSYLALKDVLHVYNVSKRWRGVIDSTPAIMRSVYLSLPNIDKTVAFRHRREELKQCKPFNWRPLCEFGTQIRADDRSRVSGCGVGLGEE